VVAVENGWKWALGLENVCGAQRWVLGFGDVCKAQKRGQKLKNASRGLAMQAGA
jgi:hypothetical protein